MLLPLLENLHKWKWPLQRKDLWFWIVPATVNLVMLPGKKETMRFIKPLLICNGLPILSFLSKVIYRVR
ncbi:hypothetical protein D3C85_1626840 [compost metagenome]